MTITSIGHSTLLIVLEDGITIITDPWFESFPFLRREPIKIRPEEIGHCDLMLVSHNHIDHLDNAGIELAKRRGATFIGSERAARRASRSGVKNVVSIKRGEKFNFRDITIHAVAAEHPLARDAVGFLISGRRNIYFSGDTRYSDSIVEDLEKFKINVAMLQIACSWYPFIGHDGMNLASASELADALNPEIIIPIHYQMRTKAVNPEEFVRRQAKRKVLILKPGVAVEV